MGSDRGVPTGWCYCGAHEWGHSKARRMCIDCGLWRRCKQKAHSEGQFDRRLKNFTLKLRWLLRPVNSLFHNIKHPVLILLSSLDGIPLHCRHRFPPPPPSQEIHALIPCVWITCPTIYPTIIPRDHKLPVPPPPPIFACKVPVSLQKHHVITSPQDISPPLLHFLW